MVVDFDPVFFNLESINQSNAPQKNVINTKTMATP
tara:strand:- start:1466 stop:1570 length:105 start_codon:yes stop_codon:yes gene_type:complete